MKLSTLQRIGGVSLILGSLLLALYSISFQLLLPMDQLKTDYSAVVNNCNWVWIAFVAFIGVILMIFGFLSVYSRIYAESGLIGFLGFLLIELAYLFQACKVTWEIFLYPTIASYQGSLPLLRDSIIKHSPLVAVLRTASSLTILLGIILFCLSLIRSKAFPKSAGILIFCGALLYGLGPMLSPPIAISGICILSIGCFILGIRLFRQPGAVAIKN
jgi:hypothetical protein